MKRVLVAGLHHESNSFNPIISDAKDFNVIYGEEIFNNLRSNDSVTGIIETLKKRGYEVVPTVFARAVPNGEIDFDFYTKIKDDILRRAVEENSIKAFDAITLSLHGSMRVKKQGEAEGFFLEELRRLFPNIPIFSSLDMHATMTKRMHDNCDGFVGYKCAPHTDCYETGEHAARMTIEALENGFMPETSCVRVPIMIAGEQSSTIVEPMIGLINELRVSENKEGIVAASYLMGFPWADNEDSSINVYVVADGDKKLAREEALRLANLIWSKKDEFCFQTETYPVKEAINMAFEGLTSKKYPIYISDSGDNPTAGASSDSTNLLNLLILDDRTEGLTHPIIYGGIYDPVATKFCEGKEGKEVTLTFGAKFDTNTSIPITATGVVKKYIKDWSRLGMVKSDLVLFNTGGVDIVISEAHVGYITPEMFVDLGVNPEDVEIVVCKLGYLTHQHSMIAKRNIMALTTGNTNEDLKSIDYKKVQRPIFPLDQNFSYEAKEYLMDSKC